MAYDQWIETLSKLSSQWEIDNSFKKYDIVLPFEIDKNDFDVKLLPFNKLDEWISLPEDLKKNILSVGWLLYQQKTIQIETQVVTPACIDILNQTIPISNDMQIKQTMSETIIDEGFHTRLAIQSCNIVNKFRQLNFIYYTEFELIIERQRFLSLLNSERKRRIASMAIACCSETLITDYLLLLSDNKLVQPLLSQAVMIHAEDEMMHERIFDLLAKAIYPQLSKEDKALFFEAFKLTQQWFNSDEINAWIYGIEQLNSPLTTPLISAIKSQNTIRVSPHPAIFESILLNELTKI